MIVPLRRRRPRPAVVDARPSGSRKAVRAEKPLLVEPRGGNVEPALRHHAAVPAPIFGGLSHAPLEFLLASSAEGVDQRDEGDDGRGCNGDPRDSRGGDNHAPFLSRRACEGNLSAALRVAAVAQDAERSGGTAVDDGVAEPSTRLRPMRSYTYLEVFDD